MNLLYYYSSERLNYAAFSIKESSSDTLRKQPKDVVFFSYDTISDSLARYTPQISIPFSCFI